MIFISHNSKDKAAALDVQRRLLGYGYDASQLFLDSDAETGIPSGSKWEQELYARLKDCRALIVLCSAKWQESRWCFAELVFAKAMGKEIFPLLLEECSIDQVIAGHQAVFVYKEGEAAYARLWDALDSRHLGPRDDFGWPPKDGDHCPFPGLPAFDERLAGVYFGREVETQTVLEDLRKMRANGEPRLLMIVGGSGSGKSSLLKAGVLPRLKHKTADTEWVVLPTLRYGEQANEQRTVFDQLAVNVAELFPKDAKSTPDWKLLRTELISDNVKQAVKVFLETSQDLTLARNCSNATVLIAIDQFEELLAPSAGPIAAQFLRFLKELLSCPNGQLLVIGTMRSDHLDIYEKYSAALQAPFFQPWRLGPFPPDRIEQVIRQPANRAKLHVTDGLVERLKRDTPTAEALPLLAFTLEKLCRRYESRENIDVQDYESLGGMEGSIQTCIERIVPPTSLSASDGAALRLTFVKHLAQVNDKGEVVRLRARWDDLPTAAKPVLEKFVNERLLIRYESTTKDKLDRRSVSIEVAHEAMFACWSDLKEWLRTSADILRWRRDVRRDQANDAKWNGLRPAQLAVARDWPKRRRDELAAEEVKWIKRGILSERIRRGIVATVVLVVALLAGIAWWQKNEAENRKEAAQVSEKKANDARDQADGLINFMLYNLRDKLVPIGRLDVLNDVARKAKEYLERLPIELVNASRQHQRASMLNNLGDVLVTQGKLQEALDAYQQSLAIAKRLAEQDKSNAGWQRALSVSYNKVGEVLVAQGRIQEALEAYQQDLAIAKRLAEQDKSNPVWQRDLSISYDRVGNVLVAQGRIQEALNAYQQGLNIRRRLAEQDKSNAGWQRDLSISYNKVGEVLEAQGKLPETLDAYQQSLAIAKRLVEQDKSNAGWQRDLSVSYNNVGDVLVAEGRIQEALDAYQQSLAIAKRLAELDKSNAGWQRDLSLSYNKVGEVLEAQGKLPEALDAYQQSLDFRRRLAEQDKSNAGSQRDLSVSYDNVGDALAAEGKLQEALNAYQQSLAIAKRLVEQDKSNATWQRDLSFSYEKVGNVLVAQGKLPEGLDAYQRSLKIHQTLAEQDKSNATWQRDLIVCLYRTGVTTAIVGTHDSLGEAQDFLRTALKLTDKYYGPDRQQLVDDLNGALQNLVH